MVQNVQPNGPNEARNTNTKLSDPKWRKIAKKNTKNGKNYPKMAKMTTNGPKWSEMFRKIV